MMPSILGNAIRGTGVKDPGLWATGCRRSKCLRSRCAQPCASWHPALPTPPGPYDRATRGCGMSLANCCGPPESEVDERSDRLPARLPVLLQDFIDAGRGLARDVSPGDVIPCAFEFDQKLNPLTVQPPRTAAGRDLLPAVAVPCVSCGPRKRGSEVVVTIPVSGTPPTYRESDRRAPSSSRATSSRSTRSA